MAPTDVSDAQIRAQADALDSTGLGDHGYSYINIDDGWNINPNSKDAAINGQARGMTKEISGRMPVFRI